MLHVLHPIFVHFSAAFLVAGASCEAAGILGRKPSLERFGSALTVAGTISLLPTVATGFLAENVLDVPPGATSLLARHEAMGLWILATFLAAQLWRAWFRGALPATQRRLYAAVLLAGVALVVWGAFLGGEMVYRLGVGVGAG